MATSVPPPDRATALQADCRQSSPLMTNGQTKISHANASESSRSSSNPGVIGTLGRPTDQHVTSFCESKPFLLSHSTHLLPTFSLTLSPLFSGFVLSPFSPQSIHLLFPCSCSSLPLLSSAHSLLSLFCPPPLPLSSFSPICETNIPLMIQ